MRDRLLLIKLEGLNPITDPFDLTLIFRPTLKQLDSLQHPFARALKLVHLLSDLLLSLHCILLCRLQPVKPLLNALIDRLGRFQAGSFIFVCLDLDLDFLHHRAILFRDGVLGATDLTF